jgi:hypothetical protein
MFCTSAPSIEMVPPVNIRGWGKETSKQKELNFFYFIFFLKKKDDEKEAETSSGKQTQQSFPMISLLTMSLDRMYRNGRLRMLDG